MARCWGSHTHSFTNPTTKDSQHLGKCRPCWLCYLHWTQKDAEKGWTGGRSAERGCPEGVNVGKVQRAFLQQHKQEIPAQRSHWAKPRVMHVLCYSDGENKRKHTLLFPSLTLEYLQPIIWDVNVMWPITTLKLNAGDRNKLLCHIFTIF